MKIVIFVSFPNNLDVKLTIKINKLIILFLFFCLSILRFSTLCAVGS